MCYCSLVSCVHTAEYDHEMEYSWSFKGSAWQIHWMINCIPFHCLGTMCYHTTEWDNEMEYSWSKDLPGRSIEWSTVFHFIVSFCAIFGGSLTDPLCSTFLYLISHVHHWCSFEFSSTFVLVTSGNHESKKEIFHLLPPKLIYSFIQRFSFLATIPRDVVILRHST